MGDRLLWGVKNGDLAVVKEQLEKVSVENHGDLTRGVVLRLRCVLPLVKIFSL